MKSSLKLAIPGLAILFVLMLCATDVMAQGGNRGRGRGGRDRGGQDENPIRLLRSESVQRDLEMMEDQIELIEEMDAERDRNREDRDRNREAQMAELEGLSEEAREKKLREMRDERDKARMSSLSDVLLPHQIDRLTQIVAQASARGGLVNGRLAESLEITDEQRDRIREKAEKLQKVLDEKIAKLRQQMQEELLAELTPEQRAQYKQMMGEPFAFENQQPGGDRGSAGDRGGRGRDRGAGGGRGGNRREGGDRNNDANI